MSVDKSRDDVLLIIAAIIGGGIVLMIVLAAILKANEDPQARLLAQQKWVQNDLFLNSLERYIETYGNLEQEADREALALGFVKRVTKDLLMFPAKDGESISVILPEQSGDKTTVMVVKEIRLGTSDNGLFQAFQDVLDQSRHGAHKPPIYMPKVDRLLAYVITGKGSESRESGVVHHNRVDKRL